MNSTLNTNYNISKIQIDQIQHTFNKCLEINQFESLFEQISGVELFYHTEMYLLDSILTHFNDNSEIQSRLINCLHTNDARIQIKLYELDKSLFKQVKQSIEVQKVLIQSDQYLYDGASNLSYFNPLSDELINFCLSNKKYEEILISDIELSEKQYLEIIKNLSIKNWLFFNEKISFIYKKNPNIIKEAYIYIQKNQHHQSLSILTTNLIESLALNNIFPLWLNMVIISAAKAYLNDHTNDQNPIIDEVLSKYDKHESRTKVKLDQEIIDLILWNYPKKYDQLIKYHQPTLNEQIIALEREEQIYKPLMDGNNFLVLKNYLSIKIEGESHDEVLINLKKKKIVLSHL